MTVLSSMSLCQTKVSYAVLYAVKLENKSAMVGQLTLTYCVFLHTMLSSSQWSPSTCILHLTSTVENKQFWKSCPGGQLFQQLLCFQVLLRNVEQSLSLALSLLTPVANYESIWLYPINRAECSWPVGGHINGVPLYSHSVFGDWGPRWRFWVCLVSSMVFSECPLRCSTSSNSAVYAFVPCWGFSVEFPVGLTDSNFEVKFW